MQGGLCLGEKGGGVAVALPLEADGADRDREVDHKGSARDGPAEQMARILEARGKALLARRHPQQEGELAPVDASARESVREEPREALIETGEQFIAGGGTERIDDVVEIVDIHDDQREGLPVETNAVQGLSEAGFEVAAGGGRDDRQVP